MLTLSSPQILCPSSSHANMPRVFKACRRHCWRRPSRKSFAFVESRQHAPDFQGRPTSILASTSPQSLCPSSSHANTPRIFPVCRRHCWRRTSRKAFALRRVTPTRPEFSRPTNVHVGVDLSANPLPSARSRQQAQAYSCGPYH